MSKSHSELLQKPFAMCLPLWSSVVFVDWHGVLSRDVFWFSILSNPKHKSYKTIRAATDKLFAEHPEMVRSWMRGHQSMEDVINALSLGLNRNQRPGYWSRRLLADCRRMTANAELLAALQEVRRTSFVVMSTDNMDCFLSQIEAIDGLVDTFDAILCSSLLGVLKSDGVHKFFRPWLLAHQLDFRDALLLDDTASICEAFRTAGGAAITVKEDTTETIDALKRWIIERGGTPSSYSATNLSRSTHPSVRESAEYMSLPADCA